MLLSMNVHDNKGMSARPLGQPTPEMTRVKTAWATGKYSTAQELADAACVALTTVYEFAKDANIRFNTPVGPKKKYSTVDAELLQKIAKKDPPANAHKLSKATGIPYQSVRNIIKEYGVDLGQ